MSAIHPRSFPARGATRESIFDAMQTLRAHDVKWRDGRVFSLVFHAGAETREIAQRAYDLFFAENGLNPTAFPSLRKFETDVVAMVASLLGGDGAIVGNMTSGGTESILVAVKAARDYFRKLHPEIKTPEMIAPVTAHPAFDKAAHYFDVKLVKTPVTADFHADPEATRAALTPNTILLVGSAPQYAHGVVDPIRELGEIAREKNILLHVDACVGGMMLPFVRQLGYAIPAFDFAVPGVTSLSVDLHKYGYAAKGASVILYRPRALRRAMMYATTEWPGGIYASPTMLGTRPGGAIAAAWAVLNYLGADGYLYIANVVMKTVELLRAGIAQIDDVKILGNPDMSVMALASDTLDIYQVGDELTARGWHLDRQQFPPSLHLTVHYAHAQSAEQFLYALQDAVNAAKKMSARKLMDNVLVDVANRAARVLPAAWVSQLTQRASTALGGSASGGGRSAALYGMIGTLPNRGDLHELVLDLVESFTTPQ
ncbi:aspartate aminotransferase family protein [Anaerolineae bacterium CFX7]|nr:aspartate aminotransferase family protein [Anaerolineae bacterium CFX7]